MKTFAFVWNFVAFSMLGSAFFPKTETFDKLQDFESNFNITNHPEEFLTNWSASEVRSSPARVFQATGEGLAGSQALGVQTTGSFNAEIYTKTTTIGLENDRITLNAKTNKNGSGNRPVYVYYSFSAGGGLFTDRLQLGDDVTFQNADSPYQEYEFFIPEKYLELNHLQIKIEVVYGEGSGTAARLFIDDFTVHGLAGKAEGELKIIAVEGTGTNLLVSFDQPLQAMAAFGPTSIYLNHGYGNPTKAEVRHSDLHLEFDDYLYPNLYEITINHLAFPTQQMGMEKELGFSLEAPIPPGSILINEFMPDPNPKGLQPENPVLSNSASHEYIELYNATEKSIRLDGLICNGGLIDQFTLAAGDFVIITSENNRELFNAYGQVKGVIPFRTLANTAGQISIEDPWGNIVDSLSYDLEWYGDPRKSTGGWSLERINPFRECSEASNWQASVSPHGGTPGAINSVYDESPDTGVFFIERVLPLSPDEITVFFSKPLTQEINPPTGFFLNKEALLLKSSQSRSLTFSLPTPMISGNEYRVEVSDFYDCEGVLIKADPFFYVYDTEPPQILRIASLSPRELKVYFNEPVKKAAAEAAGNYTVNNEAGIQAAKMADSSTVSLALSDALELNAYHTLTVLQLTDESNNLSERLTGEFFLDDQLDTAIIAGTTWLDLYFHTAVDSLSASVGMNYFVDRNIGHPKSAFRAAENHKRVHLVFDRNLPQNTLGTVTVENVKAASGTYINTHKKTFFHDNRSISVDGVEWLSDSTIILVFNKPLVAAFSELTANYSVNEDIGRPLTVVQKDLQSVILTFKEKFVEGKGYRLSIIGLRDVYGVEMTRTINLDLEFDLSAPGVEEAKLLNPFDIKLKTSEAVLFPDKGKIMIMDHEVRELTSINDREILVSSHLALTQEIIRVLVVALTDAKGNEADSIWIEIPNKKINIGTASIIKEDLIQLDLTAATDPESALSPANYVINDELPQEVLVGEKEHEIRLHLKKTLPLKSSVDIAVKQLKSKDGKQNQDLSITLVYDDGVEDLYVLNPRLIQVVHHTPLAKAVTEQSAFALKDQEIRIQPLVNQSDQRLLQLVLNQPLSPDVFYELTLPPRTSVNRETLSGSTRQVIWDKSAPRLAVIEALNEYELLVSFNEALDPVLSLITAFYGLNGREPSEVIPGDFPNQVILVFPDRLEDELVYTLTVIQVEDLNRNAIEQESLEFVFEGPASPLYKDIVINEVMAAPRPGNELPDTEYVELYNTTDKAFFLGGLFLSNSRNAVVLPRETLGAGEYLILTPASQAENMGAFGRTVGLGSWPTLLNDGDVIKLLDKAGNILDEVSYSTANYPTNEKAQGGYSLEVVNPYARCPESDNLQASRSPQRGTPGHINSVFDEQTDLTPPVLLKAAASGENSIVLEFSKKLDPDLDQAVLRTDPGLEIRSKKIDPENPRLLIVELGERLRENQRYHIVAENISDCSGNPVNPEKNSIALRIPAPAEAGDIVLSEILFNARAGAPKFVEIYNQSGKIINLYNWKLANASGGATANRRVIADKDLIIDPFSFMVFTTDAARLQQEYSYGKPDTYVELTSLPSYPIGSGSAILLDPDEELLERFDYDEKFHHRLLTDVKGVSLERYSLIHDGNDPKNWHSASASAGYATPGYKNSQTYSGGVLENGIAITPQVFVPDAPGEQNFTTISYELDQPGFVATLRIYGINGQLVKELGQNEVWGNSGFYTWDGTDLSGIKVRPGYYIVWVEILNLQGNVENIRKTVVVGSKF